LIRDARLVVDEEEATLAFAKKKLRNVRYLDGYRVELIERA
jgi:hypothetical protein